MDKVLAVGKFLMDHQALLGALVVAILDFAFAMSDKVKGNGILHQIYEVAKGLVSKPQA